MIVIAGVLWKFLSPLWSKLARNKRTATLDLEPATDYPAQFAVTEPDAGTKPVVKTTPVQTSSSSTTDRAAAFLGLQHAPDTNLSEPLYETREPGEEAKERLLSTNSEDADQAVIEAEGAVEQADKLVLELENLVNDLVKKVSSGAATAGDLAAAQRKLTAARGLLATAKDALDHARSWAKVAENKHWYIGTEGARQVRGWASVACERRAQIESLLPPDGNTPVASWTP